MLSTVIIIRIELDHKKIVFHINSLDLVEVQYYISAKKFQLYGSRNVMFMFMFFIYQSKLSSSMAHAREK